MALVLSLRKGHHFRVGGVEFVVSSVEGLPDYMVLRRDDGRRFDIGSSWVFVALGVRVRLGVSRSSSTKIVSIAIDAPGLEISRGVFPTPKSSSCS